MLNYGTFWEVLLLNVGFRYPISLNITWTVNSVAHLWGSRPYSRSVGAREVYGFVLAGFGEGYHNYHHTFPRDYRNGPQWYNVDPSKWLIYTLSKLGLAEGLVRRDSGNRAGIKLRSPMPEDIGAGAGEIVAAANPRLQQKRS